MTQAQRERLQEMVVSVEADAMMLGFEARELDRRHADRLREFLRDHDTLPAPSPSSAPPSRGASA